MAKWDAAILCGRFQQLTIGHESLVDTSKMVCDRLFIFIGSSQESGTERNPFDVITREKMCREVFGNDRNVIIHSIPDMTNENDICPEWGKYLLNHIDKYLYKVPEVMIYGNDESRSKWFDPEDIKDVTEIIVNRGRIKISATEVRAFMAKDNRREWMKWVNPKLHKMYEELRAELMSIPYYQELAMR